MSVEIFNWYEKQYPSDFRQLVKLKKYTFGEMSFLLPRVWSQLDYGQELLMCAVYNDDVALARQLLLLSSTSTSPTLLNPFWSRNYVSSWLTMTRQHQHNHHHQQQQIQYYRRSSSSSSSSSSRLGSIDDIYFDRTLSNENGGVFDIDDGDQEPPEFFFNQRIDNIFMHSPFYFSVLLKRANMCAFFIDYMKTSMRVEYLNRVIKKSGDLTRLVALALSNQSWDIAGLIMQSVEKPKSVLKFARMSEYIVQNASFCLLMMNVGAVEPHTLLVEATRRHAHATTRLLLEYFETTLTAAAARSQENATNNDSTLFLVDLYRHVLSATIDMGDQTMYAYIYAKLNALLDASKRAATTAVTITRSVLSSLTVERIVQSMTNIRRTSGQIKDDVKRNVEIREHAIAKHFDYDKYQSVQQHDSSVDYPYTSCLTVSNRAKLMEHIFETSAHTYWSDYEVRVRREVESLERFFNRPSSTTSAPTALRRRHIYIHEWSPFYVSEPILVKNLLDANDCSYAITSTDLILAARDSYSELTIHFLIDSVSSFSENTELLGSDEPDGGNFMEHLFCRLCRERQRDSRFALRRVFLDALIMRNAKMTCSRALLELALSDDQVHHYRLSSTYFPMLFLLAKCFRVFATEQDERRFEQLTAWIYTRLFHKSSPMSYEQIDLALLEFYSHRTSHFKHMKTTFSFDFSLKELARREFMKQLPTSNHVNFINNVNNSLRIFLYYIFDLTNIFN